MLARIVLLLLGTGYNLSRSTDSTTENCSITFRVLIFNRLWAFLVDNKQTDTFLLGPTYLYHNDYTNSYCLYPSQ
jgi:hypothetical protein